MQAVETLQKKQVWGSLIAVGLVLAGGWLYWSRQRDALQAKSRDELYAAGEETTKLETLAFQSTSTRASVDAGLKVALKYFESGSFQKALDLYQKIAKSPYLTDLERGMLMIAIGKTYRELHQVAEATVRFKQASQSEIVAVKKEAEKLLNESSEKAPQADG